MSLSSPTPPTPQDPNAVAATQQGYNVDSGVASQAGSQVNQLTPYGSLTYQQSGTGPSGVPLYTATTSLSPQQQQLLNTLQGTQQTAGNQANSLLTNANYGGQNPADVVGNMTSGNTQALLDKETSYLNPYFTTQTQQLDTKLRNQGLQPSPSANPSDPSSWGPYERAMNQNAQNQNQSVTGFLAQAEPAAYQQAVSSYGLPLQTAQTLLGDSQPTGPTFQNTPGLTVQPANYTGAVANYNTAQQQAYQNQLQQQNAMMSGLFSIASNGLGGWAKGGFQGLGGAGGAGGGATPGYTDFGTGAGAWPMFPA